MGEAGDRTVGRSAGGTRGAARGASRFVRIVAAVLLAAGVAALAGCGRQGSSSKTIVFWQFSPLTAIRPVLDRYEAAHPGIKVEVEQLTWQSGREKIVAAIAAGRPPDLCELGSTFLPGLVADSTLIDLTDSIPDLKPELVGWNVASYRGRAYAIPWMVGTRALFVNDQMVHDAKLDAGAPIQTWADLYKTAKAISERIPDAHGFGMNAGEREILFKKFMPFAWGNGGDILDSTLTKSVFASPQNLEALQFYLSLKPYSLLDRQEIHEQAFTSGRLGVVISGPWLIRKLQKEAPKLIYSVQIMPRPAKDHGTPASFAGAEVLGIFRGSRNKAGALDLARFLVKEENTKPVFVATGNAFPAAVSAGMDPYFDSSPREARFLDQLKTAVGPPLHPKWVEIEEIINGELEEAIYGRKTPEAALASADARINAVLAATP